MQCTVFGKGWSETLLIRNSLRSNLDVTVLTSINLRKTHNRILEVHSHSQMDVEHKLGLKTRAELAQENHELRRKLKPRPLSKSLEC